MLGHEQDDTFDGVLDAAPADDVADQQRPAHLEPTDDDHDDHDHDDHDHDEVLDADPADVADQRRDAPVLDETEPWP